MAGLAEFQHASGYTLGTLSAEHAYPVLRDRSGARSIMQQRTEEPPKKAPRRAPWQSVATPDVIPDANPDAEELDLDVILDVPVALSLEVGRTRMPIRSLLQLNRGSVIELEGLAGEPMDVLVNGTLIAQGEVVVVNEKFGIRLTDIITPAERMRKLRQHG